jgi:hypothetical protein
MNFLLGKNKQKIFYDKNDIFLVSYPKSGNTWISFIIANLLKQKEDEIIDFHSVIQYVPELGKHDDILNSMSSRRVIKSHKLYSKNFHNVIYIVRDPRDVYVSYFHYLRKSLPADMDFSTFLRKRDIYPSRWNNHVESWLDRPNLVLLIKYEDMLVDPFKETCKIAQILGIDLSEKDRINKAIESSSFEKMQKIEKSKGRPFLTQEAETKSSTFMRKGISGDWSNTLSSDDETFLLSEVGSLLARLGYT